MEKMTLSDKTVDPSWNHIIKGEVLTIASVKEFINKVKKEPYAYLCPACLNLNEACCFNNGICPVCQSGGLTPLFTDFQIDKEAGPKLCDQ